MDSIRDAAFGDLHFNGAWVRELELAFLGRTFNAEIIVEGNADESIADEQRLAYQRLPNAIAQAEKGIFEFYQSICEDYRTRYGTGADARMPRIGRASELAHLLRLTGVVFPMVMRPGEISVGFLLECSWDPEHGLGVKITNEVVEVGTQDILT